MPRGGKRIGAGRQSIEKNPIPISFTVGNDLLDKLDDYARKGKMTRSSVIRNILISFILGQETPLLQKRKRNRNDRRPPKSPEIIRLELFIPFLNVYGAIFREVKPLVFENGNEVREALDHFFSTPEFGWFVPRISLGLPESQGKFSVITLNRFKLSQLIKIPRSGFNFSTQLRALREESKCEGREYPENPSRYRWQSFLFHGQPQYLQSQNRES